MSAHDLWWRGQQIICQCINEALERQKPSAEILNELRNIQLKLQELLRGAVLHLDGLDPDTFCPWRGPSSLIRDTWGLESLCKAIAESDATTLHWDYCSPWVSDKDASSYEKWETEMGSFMQNIDKLRTQEDVAAGDQPITLTAITELCVGRLNRVGHVVAGSASTVRGWRYAKGFPQVMTWNSVRRWLNERKDYDIGPPPTEC